MQEPKYKIKYQSGKIVYKLVKPRKHSYRELERRRFNRFVLKALQSPEELINDIELYEGITAKHTIKDKGMMQTALEVANTLKREFPILGASILKIYTPYVNQIKEILSPSSTQLTIF